MQKWKLAVCGILTGVCLAGCGVSEPVAEMPGAVESETKMTEESRTEETTETAESSLPTETSQVPETSQVTEMPESSFEALQRFSYNLFAENIEEENPVLSPTSAYMALSLAGTGAQGETLEQMQMVLGEDLYSLPQELMSTMPVNEDGLKVSLANSAWIDDEFYAEKQWLEDAEAYYQAEAVNADLKTESIKDRVNEWVEKKTEGMIKDFLNQPFSDDTKLVLFNTIYFNGKWAAPFKAEATHKDDFTNTAGDVIQVEMMSAHGKHVDYFDGDLGDGVVLPYRGERYAFVAMKPADGITVRQMYEQMSNEQTFMEEMTELIGSKQNIKVNLLLPKFEVSFDKILNDSFINMGMVRAFDSQNAEFQKLGVSNKGLPLYINLVRQKAVVRVDEEGTEAAAVTMVVMNELMSARPTEPPLDVHFDEPFLYMIWDNENNLPLFMGIMDDPSKAQVE